MERIFAECWREAASLWCVLVQCGPCALPVMLLSTSLVEAPVLALKEDAVFCPHRPERALPPTGCTPLQLPDDLLCTHSGSHNLYMWHGLVQKSPTSMSSL